MSNASLCGAAEALEGEGSYSNGEDDFGRFGHCSKEEYEGEVTSSRPI